jgi:hypothetical protein
MPGFKLQVSVVTLTTAGTAYPLSTGHLPSGTEIKPHSGNSGTVYLGGSSVTGINDGYPISASVPYRMDSLRNGGHHEDFFGPSCYAVGSQNGDKVILLIPVRDNSAV